MNPKRGSKEENLPLEVQVFLNLVRAEEQLMFETAGFLRGHGLTEPQYNVLRILRGAGKDGLPCQKIAGRMLTRLPDITRLVDRLETNGLVTRNRGIPEDRRVVVIRITRSGRAVLEKLDRPILQLHRDRFSDFRPEELKQLNRLLKKVKGETSD